MLIATSKNVDIIYQSALTGLIKLEGFSTDHIMAINDVDMIDYTIGNDGYANVGVKAVKIEGSFSFFSNSPSLREIDRVQALIGLSGQPNNGILSVIFPSLLRQYVYVDFQFLSAPKGIEAKDTAQPRTIKWSSQIPNVSIVSAALQTVVGLL